mmetsp:Transcript_1664/g.1944  ORF Transcript_1664/g.1944 Transcript_1664/m.1944 type:complete len:129 (+) Transcript_1664:90-476(+)
MENDEILILPNHYIIDKCLRFPLLYCYGTPFSSQLDSHPNEQEEGDQTIVRTILMIRLMHRIVFIRNRRMDSLTVTCHCHNSSSHSNTAGKDQASSSLSSSGITDQKKHVHSSSSSSSKVVDRLLWIQ